MFIEAMLQIRAVQPGELQPLLGNLRGFDNPAVAQMNAQNLGLTQVLGVLPMREVPSAQGTMGIREFDAVSIRGFPVRVMVLVLQGPVSAVEVVIMMNLYRWMNFVGACLQLVGQIQLQGLAPATAQPQAVVDPARKDQVEYRLVAADGSAVPLTALPTMVGGSVVIHIDTLIQTGNIQGTGIAVGAHSTATVKETAAAG